MKILIITSLLFAFLIDSAAGLQRWQRDIYIGITQPGGGTHLKNWQAGPSGGFGFSYSLTSKAVHTPEIFFTSQILYAYMQHSGKPPSELPILPAVGYELHVSAESARAIDISTGLNLRMAGSQSKVSPIFSITGGIFHAWTGRIEAWYGDWKRPHPFAERDRMLIPFIRPGLGVELRIWDHYRLKTEGRIAISEREAIDYLLTTSFSW